jgi:hypothetical protein
MAVAHAKIGIVQTKASIVHLKFGEKNQNRSYPIFFQHVEFLNTVPKRMMTLCWEMPLQLGITPRRRSFFPRVHSLADWSFLFPTIEIFRDLF